MNEQKATMTLIGGDGTHCFTRNTGCDNRAEKPTPCFKSISDNHHQPQPNICQKIQNSIRFWHNHVELRLVDTINQSFFSSLFLHNIDLQLNSMSLFSQLLKKHSGLSILDKILLHRLRKIGSKEGQ